MNLIWTGSPDNLKADNNNYLIFQDDEGQWFMKDALYLTFNKFDSVDDAKDAAQEIYDVLTGPQGDDHIARKGWI